MTRRKNGDLSLLAELLIQQLTASALGICEGIVMSLAGVPPYRRLDCDGRALCYLRCRPQKGAVRIDISRLWPTNGCGPTMMLCDQNQVEATADHLRSIVAAARKR